MMVVHPRGVVHMHSVSEVSNVHVQNTLSAKLKSLPDGDAYLSGPGHDTKALS